MEKINYFLIVFSALLFKIFQVISLKEANTNKNDLLCTFVFMNADLKFHISSLKLKFCLQDCLRSPLQIGFVLCFNLFDNLPLVKVM